MAFWIALAVLLVALAAGITFVVVRGLRLWRDMKRTSALLGGEVDRVSESSREIEHHLAQAEAASARLAAATDSAQHVPLATGRPTRRGSRGACAAAPNVLVRSRPVRVGAVDLGTNSTRLLIADVEDGTVDEVVRRLAITRLGEGVDERHELHPDAIHRVHDVLDGYAREAAHHGSGPVLAIATSAVRDASNGPGFLEGLRERYGWEVRLLDGAAEAAMMFAASRRIAPSTPTRSWSTSAEARRSCSSGALTACPSRRASRPDACG